MRVFREFAGQLNQQAIPWSFWTYKDIGQMGLLRLHEDSAWMRVANSLRSDVSYIQESRLMQREDAGLKQHPFPIHAHTKHILKRRAVADQQLVMVEKMESVLGGVSFAELLEAAAAFRFDDCDPQPELVSILKHA